MNSHTLSSPNRAGRYIQQSTGYHAFHPNPLPPNPPVVIDLKMQTLLSQADQALGRLDGSIQTLPHADLFVYMYVRKEAVLSSQIEGTQSSLQDVLEAEAKVLNPNQPQDVNEVINYIDAMNHGLQRLAELPVSTRLVREIHARLLKGVRGSHLAPGEIRTSQNWIGPTGCSLHNATFIPPPSHQVDQHLGDWEKFLHSDSDLPLLIRIGLAHAQFETIHPFLDGNGRIGRLLITFMLCTEKVLLKPVLYLSHYFKQHRQTYYDQLQAVRDRGTWEDWLVFFLRGVVEVSKQATETARRILELREAHRMTITDQFGRAAGNGYRVLEHLYEQPIVSVARVQEWIDASYQTANALVTKFTTNQILEEITGQARYRQFIYRGYINLFHDDTMET